MVNVFDVPDATLTLPLGVMVPPVPAEAVIVKLLLLLQTKLSAGERICCLMKVPDAVVLFQLPPEQAPGESAAEISDLSAKLQLTQLIFFCAIQSIQFCVSSRYGPPSPLAWLVPN